MTTPAPAGGGWTHWRRAACAALFAGVFVLAGCASLAPADPLPSWNDGATKTAIVKLVTDTTREGAAGFVPPGERIAVFDNDGTLWTEHPLYTEVMFTLARVRALAPRNPAWRTQQPFKAVLEDDREAMGRFTEADFFQLIGATHAGMTPEAFRAVVAEWLATARHPRFDRPYTELVYQPMLEVLAYFRANGYKTFIVSGGTIDFMRTYADRVYGIPPEQVVGTTLDATYSFTNNTAALTVAPKIALLDDGPGKAIGIHRHIGRVPIAAFGNSDGDLAMLETTSNSPDSKLRPRLVAIVRHTDAEREYAYDRNTAVGRLSRGLDLAPQLGWHLIDMKRDWKVIYPFERK